MKITEENLVSELRRQNEKALYYVIDQYGGFIKSIIRKHLHQQDVHEECMDDILLSVWTHANSYTGEKGSFKHWLDAVSKFKAIDYERKYYRENSKVQFIGNDMERISGSYILETENELRKELEEMLGSLKEPEYQAEMNGICTL